MENLIFLSFVKKRKLYFSARNSCENPNDLYLKYSCVEHDAMSYPEDLRSRCEMSNKASVKYFSHLTIIKISEFSHSPPGESKTSQKCYDKRGRERSLKIASRVGHSPKIREFQTEIPVLKPAQRVNPHGSMKYEVDTQASLLRASSHSRS